MGKIKEKNTKKLKKYYEKIQLSTQTKPKTDKK